MKRFALIGLVVMGFGAVAYGQETQTWKALDSVFGAGGLHQADGTYRINVARTDVEFRNTKGFVVPPQMGLATYAAFNGSMDEALVVGDFAMLQHEIDLVIDVLRAGGIEVVALHNHMTTEEPRLFFMHFQGKGKAMDLANTVKKGLDLLGQNIEVEATLPGTPPVVDWDKMGTIIGAKGADQGGGVFRWGYPRKDLSVSLDGVGFLPGMGLGSWAAFHSCACGKTMVMGDTVCGSRKELQDVIDIFRKNGVSITAIHNHVFGGSQEVMFLHYEGEGDSYKLAETVKQVWAVTGRS